MDDNYGKVLAHRQVDIEKKRNTEISRFNGGGKTFFFNKGEAKNGNEFLVINALHGRQARQGMTLLPGQYMEFVKHLDVAVEELTGFSRVPNGKADSTEPNIPIQCSKCHEGSASWEIVVYGTRDWTVLCSCGNIVYSTKDPNAQEKD